MKIGDVITVKIDKQPVQATIVGFWSKDGPFMDVLVDDKIRCARRDDVIN